MERNRLFIKIEHKASELDDYYTTYTLAGKAKENTSRYVSNHQVQTGYKMQTRYRLQTADYRLDTKRRQRV